MSKKLNYWEASISSFIPYLQWDKLSGSMSDNWEKGRHSHGTYELHIITDGQCSLFVDDSELTIKSGQGILIAPEVFHASKSIEGNFSRMTTTFVLDEEKQAYFEFPENQLYLVFSMDDSIKELCLRIMDEANHQNDLFHTELITNQFAQLLLQIFRLIKEASITPSPIQQPIVQQDDMSIIDAFFRTTPPEQRTKENLAKQLHCSERHALRKIYDLYGMSFREKQALSRIDAAKHLLRTTDKSIEEIASILGYANKATLYRTFNLYTDTTPIKYRINAKR